MTIKSESEAREYIKKFYKRVGIPLPEGWDDPEVLRSLGTAMTRLNYDLTTKPEVRRMVSDSSPEKLN